MTTADIRASGNPLEFIFTQPTKITLPSSAEATLVSLADTQTLTGKTLTGAVTSGTLQKGTVTTYTGATDAIDFSLGDIFLLSRAGAADAATLAAPVAADEGRIIWIKSGTAYAHTITVAGGVGGSGTSYDVLTFTNVLAANVTLRAYALTWNIVGQYLTAVA